MLSTTNRVTNILKADKLSRNSDKRLWLVYAKLSGVGLSPEQEAKIMEMPEFETLRRIRQSLQHEGKYEADPQIKIERKQKAQAMKQATVEADTDKIEQVIKYRPVDWEMEN